VEPFVSGLKTRFYEYIPAGQTSSKHIIFSGVGGFSLRSLMLLPLVSYTRLQSKIEEYLYTEKYKVLLV